MDISCVCHICTCPSLSACMQTAYCLLVYWSAKYKTILMHCSWKWYIIS